MKKNFNLLFIIFIMILSIDNVSAKSSKTDNIIGVRYDIDVELVDKDNNPVRNSLLCLYDIYYYQMDCFKTNHYGKTRFNVLSGKYFIRQETAEDDYIKVERYDLDVQDDIDLILVNELRKEEPIIIEEPIIDVPIKEEIPNIEEEEETITEEIPIIEETPIIEEIEVPVIEVPIKEEEEPIIEDIPITSEDEKFKVVEEIPIIIKDKKDGVMGVNKENTAKSTKNTKKAVKTPKNTQKIEDNSLIAMNIGVDSDNRGALVYSESKENDKSVDNSQVIFYVIFITLLIIIVGIIINKIRVKARQKV